MRADGRIWRTARGALVADGHPDAAFLAYAEGDEITAGDAALLAEAKQASPAPNKAKAKPDTKAR